MKKVQADNLVDNAKIVENNTTVARFLQSLDTDGDASNGIQITDETITILTKALQTEKIDSVPDTTAKLDTVVSYIEQEDTNYKGHVVTEDEAQTHLQSTQKTVLQDLIAGKTFYVVGQEDSEIKIFKFVVSTDGTEFKQYNLDAQFTDDGSITYNGNNIKIGSGDGYSVFTPKNGYILGQDYLDNGSLEQGIGHRLYSTQSDAQKYYDSLSQGEVTNNTGVTATDLKTLFAGKTFYMLDDDGGNQTLVVAPVIFNEDATTMKVGENDTPWQITIEDGKIVDHDGDHFIDEVTDTYVKGHDSYEEFVFYVNKADADAQVSTTFYHLQESDIAGHTIKVGDPSKDKQYFTDGTYTSLESDTNERHTGTWSIVDGKLKHVWDSNGNVEIHHFAAKPATGVTLTNETYDVSAAITDFI